MKTRTIWMLAVYLCVMALLSTTARAQQAAGDKELGLGALVTANHSSDFQGTAIGLFSLGYFKSTANYFGVEVDPIFQFAHSGGSNSVTIGAFTLGNYRRFFRTRSEGRIYPFVGGGAGGAISGTIGSGSGATGNFAWFGEAGLKNYISQKTSLEFAYKFLQAGTSGGFLPNTQSLFTISFKHIF